MDVYNNYASVVNGNSNNIVDWLIYTLLENFK